MQTIINKVDRKSVFKLPRGTFDKFKLFFSEKGHVATILGFVQHVVKYIAGKKVGNLFYSLHGHEKVLSNKILFMNSGCTILYNVAK